MAYNQIIVVIKTTWGDCFLKKAYIEAIFKFTLTWKMID